MTEAILDHLWQSTLFAAFAGLLTLAFRNNAAGIRFWLWFAASLKFLVPFAAIMAAGHWIGATLLPAPSASTAFDAMTVVAPFGATRSPLADFALWLAAIWAAGAIAIAAHWFLRGRKLQAIVRAARPIDMPAPMQVLSSPAAIEPGLVGVFSARLILPDGIVERLTPAQMSAMMAHEICHLKRRDNFTAAIHMLVETLFWFHPLVWWLGARMIEERERACDEAVVAAGNEPHAYAEGIIAVCKHYLKSPLACAAGISGADLKKRMEEIMANKTPAALTMIKKAALTGAALAALALPLALGVMSAPAAAQGAPITRGDWLERPNGRSFDLHYPKAAAEQNLGGRAVLDCTVRNDGRLDCTVRSESPEGAGFGAAALAIAPAFKMAPKDRDGANTAGRPIMIPISFAVGAAPAGAPPIEVRPTPPAQ